MSDNYEKDMALTLKEVLDITSTVTPEKIEISRTHEKTISFLDENIIHEDDVLEIISQLNIANYIKGPEPDDKPSPKRNKPVWIFKRYWENIVLYIKLKIFITNRKVYIVSLHEDERGDSNEK